MTTNQMSPKLALIVNTVETTSMDELVYLFSQVDANNTQVGGSHYSAAYQHWDFMAELRPSWPEGCMSKYLCRVFKKNGLQDVEKVLHYCYKLMEQVYNGVADVPQGLTLEQRNDLYIKFFQAQDVQAPTAKLRRDLKDCFRQLSSWETLSDLRTLFLTVLSLYHGMTDYFDEVQVELATRADPVCAAPEQGTEPTPGYVQQDQQAQYEPLTRMELVKQIASRTASILPIKVYSKVLEDHRRGGLGKLDLKTSDEHPPFCRDYAEAGLKVELACSHLRESLPNRQVERTSLALACLMDGAASLTSWYILRNISQFTAISTLTAETHRMGFTLADLMLYMHNIQPMSYVNNIQLESEQTDGHPA